MNQLLQVGGESKIKSAVTVCSLDRVEHTELELVSITDWDLLLAWDDPAGRGCSGLKVGFYCLKNLFVFQRHSSRVRISLTFCLRSVKWCENIHICRVLSYVFMLMTQNIETFHSLKVLEGKILIKV